MVIIKVIKGHKCSPIKEANGQEKHLSDDFFCREVAKKKGQPSVSK